MKTTMNNFFFQLYFNTNISNFCERSKRIAKYMIVIETLVVYHLYKYSGNFGWEFSFGKNGTCCLPFA